MNAGNRSFTPLALRLDGMIHFGAFDLGFTNWGATESLNYPELHCFGDDPTLRTAANSHAPDNQTFFTTPIIFPPGEWEIFAAGVEAETFPPVAVLLRGDGSIIGRFNVSKSGTGLDTMAGLLRAPNGESVRLVFPGFGIGGGHYGQVQYRVNHAAGVLAWPPTIIVTVSIPASIQILYRAARG